MNLKFIIIFSLFAGHVVHGQGTGDASIESGSGMTTDSGSGMTTDSGSGMTTDSGSGMTTDSGSGMASESGSGSEGSGKHERQIETQFSGKKLQIEAQSKTADDKSAIAYEVSSNEGFRTRLALKNETATGKIEFKFRIRVEKIFEFAPGEDGVFSGSGAVKTTDLTKNEVTMTKLSDVTSSSGAAVQRFSYVYGSMEIILYVSGADTSVDGVELDPDSIKFDVNIKGYIYSDPNNRLALSVKIDAQSKEKVAKQPASTSSTKGAISVGEGGYLAFARTATCAGGAAVEVVASAPTEDDTDKDATKEAGEDTKIVIFSFKTATQGDICWDPVIGTGSEIVDDAGSTTPDDSNGVGGVAPYFFLGIIGVAAAFL